MSLMQDYLIQFGQATVKTLEQQCSFACTFGQIQARTAKSNPPIDIAAIIALKGAQFNGTMALCLSDKVFVTLMSNMLGEQIETINSEVQDGASELLNMIFGQGKIALNQHGHALEMARPSVLTGEQLQRRFAALYNAYVLPFESKLGSFYMEINAQD